MSFPIYRHDKSWDAWVGVANDDDARWSTAKRPSIWKRLRSDDRRATHPDLETIDAVAMTSEPADETADASETPERDSFWKRERSFGRRKSGDEPQNDEVEPELSWWTRRSDEDQVTAEDDVAHAGHSDDEGRTGLVRGRAAPAAEKQSIWKRELSFGAASRRTGTPLPSPRSTPSQNLWRPACRPARSTTTVTSNRARTTAIAQAELEPTAEPVGWWPQSPSAAAAGPSDEGDAPSTDVEYPTFSSWRPAESSHVDNEDDVESDGWQSAQAELAADEGPVDEYEAEADEIAEASETPERDSFWKRERSFGRRKSEEEPQTDEVEVELSWWSRGSDDDQVAADDRAAHADHARRRD